MVTNYLEIAFRPGGRGQSSIAAIADGAATAVIDKIPGLNKFDNAADEIQSAANKISPTPGNGPFLIG